MKHQIRGLRNFLLGLVVLAAIGPVGPLPASGRTAQAAPQAAPAQQGGPSCQWPSWSCSGVNYGSTPPAWAPRITYITDYQSVLSCVNNITVSQALPGSGNVALDCPGWPQPVTIRECPTNEVIRMPYPRALVTVPVTFTLQDALLPKLQTAVAGPPARNATMPRTNYGVLLVHGAAGLVYLSVRGTRLQSNTNWFGQQVISPTWTFQDRSWHTSSAYPPVQRHISATYQYATSSYGLPEKGRGYDYVQKLPSNNYDLPAYPVQLATPCKYEYQVIVQKSWPFWTYTNPARTAGVWNEQWVNITSAWQGINMRDHGYPNTYEWWNVVRSGGVFKNVQYWDQPEPSQIWIPVLEVQSVLRSEQCATAANCPQASAASITAPTGGPGGTNGGSLTYGGTNGGGGSIINPPTP
jgi:hypothetical protein